MIGEKYFIENYNFFWNSTLPMTKFFLRKVNLELLKKSDDFLESKVFGRRKSYLSEVAFLLFADTINKKINLDNLNSNTVELIEKKCKARFENFKEDDIEDISRPLNPNEIGEVIALASRLINFFHSSEESIIISPRFRGCGFIDSCYGDVIVKDTLFEVKIVDRNFQANDCKQLITYCALNYLSKDYDIKNLALYNPRKGTYFKMGLDEFSLMISGKSSTELFNDIIEFISGGGVSK